MNIWVYIDGFNLYNGALKATAFKWLNPLALAEKLRPTDEITKVKMFVEQ